jgi:hypothetical protein
MGGFSCGSGEGGVGGGKSGLLEIDIVSEQARAWGEGGGGKIPIWRGRVRLAWTFVIGKGAFDS